MVEVVFGVLLAGLVVGVAEKFGRKIAVPPPPGGQAVSEFLLGFGH